MAPAVDVTWWTRESFRGVPLRDILAARDFGSVFGFLKSRGWSVGAIAATTRVQEARVREIIAGRRKVTSYEVIERIATGLSIDRGMCGIGMSPERDGQRGVREESLQDLMGAAERLDARGLVLLMSHTDHIRQLNDGLGPQTALTAVLAHVDTLARLRAYCVAPWRRRQLAKVFHDASCLAGGLAWRCGDESAAWRHHETAKEAARDASCPPLVAHSLRQQCRLLDEGGQSIQRRQLEEQIRELSGRGQLPEVAHIADPAHFHLRLYQPSNAPWRPYQPLVALELPDGGVEPGEFGVEAGMGDA